MIIYDRWKDRPLHERQTVVICDEWWTNKDRLRHERIRATDNKKYQNVDGGWRRDRWKRVRPWRPGQIGGCTWCSKSVMICVGVRLFMTSHFSKKNFFDIQVSAVTAHKIGSAPQKIDLFDFLVSRTVLSSQKTQEKNKKSWAIVSFKKWAFMILCMS